LKNVVYQFESVLTAAMEWIPSFGKVVGQAEEVRLIHDFEAGLASDIEGVQLSSDHQLVPVAAAVLFSDMTVMMSAEVRGMIWVEVVLEGM
jgi:hypothetical protein